MKAGTVKVYSQAMNQHELKLFYIIKLKFYRPPPGNCSFSSHELLISGMSPNFVTCVENMSSSLFSINKLFMELAWIRLKEELMSAKNVEKLISIKLAWTSKLYYCWLLGFLFILGMISLILGMWKLSIQQRQKKKEGLKKKLRKSSVLLVEKPTRLVLAFNSTLLSLMHPKKSCHLDVLIAPKHSFTDIIWTTMKTSNTRMFATLNVVYVTNILLSRTPGTNTNGLSARRFSTIHANSVRKNSLQIPKEITIFLVFILRIAKSLSNAATAPKDLLPSSHLVSMKILIPMLDPIFVLFVGWVSITKLPGMLMLKTSIQRKNQQIPMLRYNSVSLLNRFHNLHRPHQKTSRYRSSMYKSKVLHPHTSLSSNSSSNSNKWLLFSITMSCPSMLFKLFSKSGSKATSLSSNMSLHKIEIQISPGGAKGLLSLFDCPFSNYYFSPYFFS